MIVLFILITEGATKIVLIPKRILQIKKYGPVVDATKIQHKLE